MLYTSSNRSSQWIKYLLLTVFIPCQLMGWWDGGHLVVTQIAYEQLDPEVREQVDHLSAGFTEEYPDHADFVALGAWMDAIRVTGGLHAFDSWHYTDIPFDRDGVLSEHDRQLIEATMRGRDVVWAIRQAMATLSSSKASDYEKRFMLAVLAHCIGDIHQPLHCCTRYTVDLPQGDRGGNSVLIVDKQGISMHMLWDSGIGQFPWVHAPYSMEDREEIRDYALMLMIRYPLEAFPEVSDEAPEHWAREGHRFAKEIAYNFIDGEPLEDNYIEDATELTQQRVTLAGYRLAMVLNRLLKRHSEQKTIWTTDDTSDEIESGINTR